MEITSRDVFSINIVHSLVAAIARNSPVCCRMDIAVSPLMCHVYSYRRNHLEEFLFKRERKQSTVCCPHICLPPCSCHICISWAEVTTWGSGLQICTVWGYPGSSCPCLLLSAIGRPGTAACAGFFLLTNVFIKVHWTLCKPHNEASKNMHSAFYSD